MKTLLKHAPKKGTLPILEHIAVKNNRATISDCDFWLSHPCDHAEGVYKATGFVEMPLKTDLDIADFPIPNELKDAYYSHEYKTADFLPQMSLAAKAMSNEEARYYLKGVYFHADKLVATNGHILHAVNVSHALPEAGVIIPDKAVNILIDLMKETKTDVRAVFYDKYIRFNIGSYELVTKLVDGNFPDYNRVIPDHSDMIPAKFNAEEIKAVEKKVKILKKQEGIKGAYSVEIKGDKLFRKDTELATLSFSMPYACFNYDYLAGMPSGEFTQRDKESPARINHALGVSIIMPMRRNY